MGAMGLPAVSIRPTAPADLQAIGRLGALSVRLHPNARGRSLHRWAAQESEVTEPASLVSHEQPVDDLPRRSAADARLGLAAGPVGGTGDADPERRAAALEVRGTG